MVEVERLGLAMSGARSWGFDWSSRGASDTAQESHPARSLQTKPIEASRAPADWTPPSTWSEKKEGRLTASLARLHNTAYINH